MQTDKSIERYLLNKLYHHVENIDRDLHHKIDTLRGYHKQFGGGERSDKVMDRKDAVLSYVDSVSMSPKKVRELEPMIATLEKFQNNVGDVMHQIEELHSQTESFQSLDLTNARFDTDHHKSITIDEMYSDYLQKLASYNVDHPLEVMRDPNGIIAMIHKNDDLDFTGLLELFRPLIGSYQILRENIRENKDLDTVLTVIREQTRLDVNVLKNAKDALKHIVDKLNSIETDFKVKNYELVEKTAHSIIYSINSVEGETYQIPIVDSNTVTDYTTKITIDQQDSLNAIRLDSMKVIQEYIDSLDPLTPAVELDTELKLSAITEDLKRIMSVDGQLGQLGGDHDEHIKDTDIVVQPDTYTDVYSLVAGLIDINRYLLRVRETIDQTLLNRERKMFYLMYLTQVGMMNDISDLEIYRYIDLDTVNFYMEVLNRIVSRIQLLGISKTVDKKEVRQDRSFLDAEYFRSYHYYLVQRMTNLMKFISEHLEPGKVINISRIDGPIYGDFVLFNHFKDILKSYHEKMMSD